MPPLDRPDIDEGALTAEQRTWRRDGVVILPKFLPKLVTDPFAERFVTPAIETQISMHRIQPRIFIAEKATC